MVFASAEAVSQYHFNLFLKIILLNSWICGGKTTLPMMLHSKFHQSIVATF